MHIPSGSAFASNLAATLIASPYKLSPEIITSPKFNPTLNRIFWFSGSASLINCILFWIEIDASVAFTGLANSAITLSPADPNIRPLLSSIIWSIISLRCLKTAKVISSSIAISLLKLTTSSANIVLSFRSIFFTPGLRPISVFKELLRILNI